MWQPIETAPKDGRAIIGLFTHCREHFAESVYWVADTPGRGAWHWVQDADQPVNQPTHWMPLPEPPND